jgi:hypothetical protein
MVVKPNPAPEKREIRVRGPADAKSVKTGKNVRFRKSSKRFPEEV